MTPNDSDAFNKITAGPELRGVGNDQLLGGPVFYGMLVMAGELLLGGLGALIFLDWKILVGTAIVVLATVLVVAAITARQT